MLARRVAIDLTCWARGPHTGVGLSARRCFEALRERGDDGLAVEAVCRDPGRVSEGAAPFQLAYRTPWRRALGDPGILWHSFEAGLPLALRSPKVLTIHDLWTFRESPYQSAEYRRRQSRRLRRAIERADRFTTPTHSVKAELERWDPRLAGRVAVVPWAPLLETGRTSPPAPEVGRYLAEGRPFVLCVACLETRKNLSMLFEAMRARRDLDLVLVGAPGHGVERVLRDREALELSGTRVVSFRHLSESSLAALYSECLLLAQPSLEEGFGMPVVEAMRYSRPLVLSRIPAFEEVAAEAALYFELRDGAEGLRFCLESVRRDPALRERLGRLSGSRAGRFSWRRTAELLAGVYRELSPW